MEIEKMTKIIWTMKEVGMEQTNMKISIDVSSCLRPLHSVLREKNRRWAQVKEVYEILDHRVPHAEFLFGASEKEMSLVFIVKANRVQNEAIEL
ncbi:hypothetical protein Lal_00034650 [Lupinus albus]|nr:hypothetical protein Lal_00034650 [Lupinus albus]